MSKTIRKMDEALSASISKNREMGVFHLAYDRERTFIDAVKSGDAERVRAVMLPLKNEDLGLLSEDPLRNMKYHLTITIALITRACIEAGMPAERAYTLSDIYIRQLDTLRREEEITALHRELVFDYTKRMQALSRERHYAKPVAQAMAYIEQHLNEKIALEDIAKRLSVSRTSLCRLFRREVGCTVGDHIRRAKVRAAAEMLRHSELPLSAIGNQLAFSSQSHFIRVFREEMGVTPTQYRQEHGCEEI